MALQFIPIDHAEVQRYLPMRTTIFQCEDFAARAAVEDDRFTGETARQGFSHLQFIAPGDRIPVIRMRAHAAQIDGVGRMGGAQRHQARHIVRHLKAPPAKNSLGGSLHGIGASGTQTCAGRLNRAGIAARPLGQYPCENHLEELG